MELLILIIPIITVIILVTKFRENTAFWEYLLVVIPTLLLFVLLKYSMIYCNSLDTEYQGDLIDHITYYEDWDETVMVTHTRTVSCGKGKTRTETYVVPERRYHPKRYVYETVTGETNDVSEDEYKLICYKLNMPAVFKDMHRSYRSKDGDAYVTSWNRTRENSYPVTWTHLYQNKVKAFKDLKIRQAFSYAINRQQLANNILKDGSIPAKGFVPSGMGTNPKTGAQFENDAYVKSGVSYNLKKAKTLLQEGYKETGIKSIKVTLLASDDDSSKQTAEFLQSQLDRLPNVNISVQNIPFTQLISRQTAGNYEITIKNWQAVFGDPINFLDVFQKGSSYLNNGWNNNQFNKLLDQSENVYGNDPVKRWDKLVAAEKILMKDQGTIPLIQVAHPQLLKTNVKGVSFNPTGVPYDFKNVYFN